jgi:hypothetical protein
LPARLKSDYFLEADIELIPCANEPLSTAGFFAKGEIVNFLLLNEGTGALLAT